MVLFLDKIRLLKNNKISEFILKNRTIRLKKINGKWIKSKLPI